MRESDTPTRSAVDAPARDAIDAVWRIEAARLIGGLVRFVRDVVTRWLVLQRRSTSIGASGGLR